MELPEEDPNIFDLYLGCVYENDAKLTDRPLGDLSEEDCDLMLILAGRIWIFADRMGDCASANLMIDIFLRMPHIPSMECVRYIFLHTPVGSLLRKLCVDQWACHMSSAKMEKLDVHLLPQDFLVEVLRTKLLAEDLDVVVLEVQNALLHRDVEEQRVIYYQYDHLHPKPVEEGEGKEGGA